MSETRRVIKFTERTICYIDLLGFSSAVMDRAKKDPRELEELAELLAQTKENLDTLYSEADLVFQSLSDSIFIATPDNSRESLTAFVSCIQDMYLHFMKNGFLARGGIATGSCFINDYIVLGEPVVRAVKLEETVAEYPRIVLNSAAVLALREVFDSAFFERSVKRGNDGPYWIDPFDQIISEVLHHDDKIKQHQVSDEKLRDYIVSRDSNIDTLNRISAVITENLERAQENRRVFSMYYWMYQFYSSSLQKARDTVGSSLHLPQYKI